MRFVMAVASSLAAVSWARTYPTKSVRYVVPFAAGTSPQLSFELFKLMAKIDVVNIPYKNGAQGISDNAAGQVPIGISNFPASVAPVQSADHPRRVRPVHPRRDREVGEGDQRRRHSAAIAGAK